MGQQDPVSPGRTLPWGRAVGGGDAASAAEPLPLPSPRRVPALPVKNLNGTGPVHPALAGKGGPATGRASPRGDTGELGGRKAGWMAVGWTDGRTAPLARRRDDGHPPVCRRAARLPDPCPQARPAPAARQQERHQTRARGQWHLQEDQEAAPQKE